MQINEMSPAALAYLGDSVLELMTRTMLVKSGVADAGKLNKLALDYVKATAQCDAFDRMSEHLTDDEMYWFKRGRNHSTSSAPKSASTGQYRKATGLEVLFAYLYLEGKRERMEELFEIGFKKE
ncbi:MAG: ribonuclease III [Ruminococcaceae bacterium]|nr:ribonuclease III [Oscillospiraceae bacterium]